jgi:hypothetical protein
MPVTCGFGLMTTASALGFLGLGDAKCNAAQLANPSSQNTSAARPSLRSKLRPPNHTGSAKDTTNCPPTTTYSSRRRTRSALYRPVHSACAPAQTTTTYSATPAPCTTCTHNGGGSRMGPTMGTRSRMKKAAARRLSTNPRTPGPRQGAGQAASSSVLLQQGCSPPSAEVYLANLSFH